MNEKEKAKFKEMLDSIRAQALAKEKEIEKLNKELNGLKETIETGDRYLEGSDGLQ